MTRWASTTLLCLTAVTAAITHAQSAIADPVPSGIIGPSERARAMARKLDATGYYSRYSRALKGYPHLRSKRDQPRSPIRTFAVNSENRRLFRSQIQQIALKHSLDYQLIDAVILVESAYNPKAVSPKGAMGLMQLMPATAERFNVADPFDPADNINGGARYLRWLMQRFDGNLQLVLAAYNAGEGAVARNGNQIPPYAETQTYVKRVLGIYKP